MRLFSRRSRLTTAGSTTGSTGERGFLTRLARDRRGNVLALVALSTLPIAGFVGSGLDLSRAYLVRTRLQQACDAGVLAGRKVMGAGGTLTTSVSNEVAKFVNFNFPQTTSDTAAFAIAPAVDGTTDTISLTLATTMNTAIMKLFGIRTMPISVTCSARDDYANIDIVLVLDTTGSMACKPERNASSCSTFANNNSGKTMRVGTRTISYVGEEVSGSTNLSRMQGLRDAAASLQVQMAAIESSFSSASAATRKRIRWAIVPFSQMTNPGFSRGPAGTTLYARNPSWFNTSGTYRQRYNCGNGRTCTRTTDVSHDADWIDDTWDGCTEERGTSNAITGTSTYQIPGNLPAAANDLKFDTAATTAATRWTVSDPAQDTSSQYACPKPIRELGSMTAADFTTYFALNQGFVPNGGTFLDIGLLWAARLLSRNGPWGSDNPAYYHGFPVRRYVIFMTDGEMDTGTNSYSAYAQETTFRRTTTDGVKDTSDDNHTRRWLMTCTAIKNMDVKIYAISFGSGSALSTDMAACSSGAGYGYKADDNAALTQAFKDIGENIGSLRLSQ